MPLLCAGFCSVDDLVACCDLGGRLYGRGDGTVCLVRELYRVGHGLFGNVAAMHDMVDVKGRKFARMCLGPSARDLDVIARNVLPFLLKDRLNVECRAARDRDQQHL